MAFCIVVMALKVTSVIPKWLYFVPPLITFEPLGRFGTEIMPIRGTSLQSFLIASLQSF
jgi:hypothetical protein